MRQLDKLFDKLPHVVFTLCDGLTNCLLYESALQSHVRPSFSRTYQTCLIRATELSCGLDLGLAVLVLFYETHSVLGTSLLWRPTVAFTYLKVKSAKCLCLLPVVLVLVLLIWSWSWS